MINAKKMKFLERWGMRWSLALEGVVEQIKLGFLTPPSLKFIFLKLFISYQTPPADDLKKINYPLECILYVLGIF